MRVATSLFCFCLFSSVAAGQTANHIVISEVYGGGGNAGAIYKNDFIELYNPTNSPVDLSGWSVQYASATGSTWNITLLTGSIPAYGFYLVQEAQGSGGNADLPTPNAVGTITMNGTDGKVALVNSTIRLTDSIPAPSSYINLIGYGKATGFQGTGPAPAPSNTKSAERKAQSTSTAETMAPGGGDASFGNGCDTDDNAADFVAQLAINPQNSSSPAEKLVDSSLPVSMRETSAKVESGKVILTFSTASEMELLGFNIWRAAERAGPFQLISSFASNPALKACGENNSGADYSYTDSKVTPGKTYYYKIETVNSSGGSGQAGEILRISVAAPAAFGVFQNFPNPFNPVTSISYELAADSRVTLKVYDVAGREVAVLVDALQPAGAYSSAFNGAGRASGVYFYRLEARSPDGRMLSVVRKMILVK